MDASLVGDVAVLVGAALLLAGVILSEFAHRLQAPSLLLFLGVGMLLGDDVAGLIHFDDANLAQRIGVIALVVILFEGGLGISVRDVREVVAPAAVLATLGVVITAATVGAVLYASTDSTPITAALLGSVVASTDAAAVFAMLRKAPLPNRLSALLKAESGGNDPMAVLLTIGVIEVWRADPAAGDWIIFGLRQVGGGILVGVSVGWATAWLIRRLEAGEASFHPVLSLGAAGLAYGLGTLIGASGFMAVFLCGILVAAGSPRYRRSIRHFNEGLGAVAQITLFLMLGLLVLPSQLLGVAGLGLVTAAVLMFVARPLAVAVCTMGSRLDPREKTLVAWAGLRGAVPVVLATFPLTAGYPEGNRVFDVVFFVVITSVLVQGMTIAPLARRLGLPAASGSDVLVDLVPVDAPGVDVVEIELVASCGVIGHELRSVPLPPSARIGAVMRRNAVEVPTGDTVFETGDLLIVVAPSSETLSEELQTWAAGTAGATGSGAVPSDQKPPGG